MMISDTFPRSAADFVSCAAPSISDALHAYAQQARASANDSLGPKLSTLIGLVIALVIQSKPLARRYLREARTLATPSEVAESITAAAALRAGGAIGYGRLAFKLLEEHQTAEPESDRSRIHKDREYMTQLRRADPAPFDQLARFMASLHAQGLALPAKSYELMAVAGAIITQCVYCLEKHVNDAKKAGASPAEIADVVHMAVVLRAESVIQECDDSSLLELLGGMPA